MPQCFSASLGPIATNKSIVVTIEIESPTDPNEWPFISAGGFDEAGDLKMCSTAGGNPGQDYRPCVPASSFGPSGKFTLVVGNYEEGTVATFVTLLISIVDTCSDPPTTGGSAPPPPASVSDSENDDFYFIILVMVAVVAVIIIVGAVVGVVIWKKRASASSNSYDAFD